MKEMVAAIVGALLKEAPEAVLAILRGAGLLPDGDDAEHIAALNRSAASIMADNPFEKRRRRRVVEIVHNAPEYDDEGGPPPAA